LAFGGNNTAGPIDVATARNACASASGRMDFELETFLVQPARPVGFNARQDPDHWHDRTGPLDTDGGTQAVAFAQNSRDEVRLEGGDGQRCGALSTGGGKPGQGVPMVATTARIRRITPTEAERLMGFPDNYTAIPWRKKPADQCPDGPRYRALGNSWAIPVVRWIGQRIDSVLSRGQTRPSHVEAAQKRSTPESGEQRRDRTGS
jgi:DNA (cytosine-5)-methyltransferase 1